MSGEAPSRKKKDRRKRKEDEEGLLGSGEKSGSGWCVKLVFLLLIGSVSLAIGVVFLEIDANKDLSTLLSASSEKVSSVLEETSARVSSLWDENGSSASSLWETVKESVGLEGDKTPLEDLADKKDVNVEESASVPEAKSEEFFDEGDDYYEDEMSIPVEQPEGVVAPEPVVPADSYVEPPVEPEIVPVQQAPVEDEPPLAEEGENLPTHEEAEEEHTPEQEVLAQITPEHEQESAESVEHTPQEEVLAAVTPEHERLQSLEEEIIQHIPNEEFLAAVTPEHAAEGHSSEAEEAPEILEDAPEDFVSTPVASLEEAQSVPQEDVSAEEVAEDQSVPLADPLGTHYVEEPQSDEVESQEEVPEIVNNAPEDVVSAPAIDDLDQVQSVPESDVVPETSEEQPHYADSYGNAPTSQEVENEITESEEVETDPEEALKASYPKIDITNDDDWEIRDELDSAEETVSKSAMEALSKFEDLLRDHPNSPRALYGRALALDKLSDKERSNSRLEQAIFAYRNVIDLEAAVPDSLYRLAGKLSVERMKFRGFHGKAIRTQQRLILRFPDDLALRNELAIVYLTVGQNDAARELLEDILKKWPESGVAKVHYGFILKNIEQKMEEGAKYMQEGIDSKEPLAIDGRFYYHLGDAYERLGKRNLAMKVYEEGAKLGLFRSKDQRSLYNVDRLQSKPFWTKEETTYQDFFNKLEANWEAIRDEGVSLMNLTPPEGFKDEAESLRDTGDWKQFELFARGRKLPGCAKAPKTCALIESFHPASTCKRGQAKFSVMHPGTHVWPHTGPTNCRLRSHLGLKVPEGVTLRVADETSKWEEGKLFIFDDSFDHEVWHNGTTFRLVLIVDVWHPDLTENERQTLTAI